MAIINNIPSGNGIKIINGELTYNGYPIKGVDNIEHTIAGSFNRAWFITEDLLATMTEDTSALVVYKLGANGATTYWTGEAGEWEMSSDGAYLLHLPSSGGKILSIYEIKNGAINTTSPKTVELTTTCKWVAMSANGTYLTAQTGSGTMVYVYKKAGDTYTFLYSQSIGSSSRNLYHIHFMMGSETELCATYRTSSSSYLYTFIIDDTKLTTTSTNFYGDSTRGVYLPSGVFMGYTYTCALKDKYFTYGDWTTRFCRIYNDLNGDCFNYDLDKLGYMSDAKGNKKFYFVYNNFYIPTSADNGHNQRKENLQMSSKWIIKYIVNNTAGIAYRKIITPSTDKYILGIAAKEQKGIIENKSDIQNLLYDGTSITLALPNLQSGKAGANFTTTYTNYQNVCSFVNPFGNFTFSATVYFENSSTTFNGFRIRVNDQVAYSAHKGEVTNSSTVTVNISSQIGDMIYFDFRGKTPEGVVSGTQLSNIKLTFTELGCPLLCIMGS
jgi:hypothetical protein